VLIDRFGFRCHVADIEMGRPGTALRFALLLGLCAGSAAAQTTYNLERDLKTPGTRAVALFGLAGDPILGVPEAGIVKHFKRSDGSLLRTLRSPAPATGDRFGFSVTVAGSRIAVGAPGDDGAGPDSGAVFVFNGSTGTLERTLRSPTPVANAGFGFAVGARGDDIIVGSPFGGGTHPDAGVAYLFNGVTGALRLTFTNAEAANDDFFGAAVASQSGDILVGAPLESGAVRFGGAAFFFNGNTGARLNVFRGPGAVEGDLFGASVARLGGDVLIGAPFAEGVGAVFRFDRLGTAPKRIYMPPPELPVSRFGTAVIPVGLRDLLVSAPGGEFEEFPAAFLLDGERETDNLIQAFFPLVPAVVRGPFVPPLAASGRDVLVEDALFRNCGRDCDQGCGNGIIESDLGETCDDGDDTNALCPGCASPGPIGDDCSRCDDGDACTQDQCLGGGVCAHAEIPGCTCRSDADCDDANVCDGSERCRDCAGCSLYAFPCCERDSRCPAGEPLQCTDQDPCTINSCDPLTGCRVDPGGCPTTTTSSTSTTTSPVPSTTSSSNAEPSTTSTSTTPASTTSTSSRQPSTTSTSTSTFPVPPSTSTSTTTTPAVSTSTSLQPLPGPICSEDADCSGGLCEGPSRCRNGRCVQALPPTCFAAATCVLSAGLPLGSCPEAPPAKVVRSFERAYALVLGAEAAAPSSMKKAKRRLRAAERQLTRARKLVEKLAQKDMPASCADALLATITGSHDRTQSLATNLADCAS
jgi:hypothetical protein